MTSVSASTLSSIEALQSALVTLATLAFTDYNFPANCTYENKSSYDYIVVGGGSAGSAVSSRLSESGKYSVLLLEAGGNPPLESKMPGAFTALPKSKYDYDVSSTNDYTTAQSLIDGIVSLTIGKMLGGGSSINHMIHVQGDPHDFELWAKAAGDNSWNYTNLLPYFKKLEKLIDSGLLNSTCADYHGTDGMMPITRETNSKNQFLLDALYEIGHKIIEDVSQNRTGVCEPLYNIANDVRQSNAYCYLGAAISRSNLCVGLSSKVGKILIENGTAYGVQVTTAGGFTYEIYANKEVIVTAGAIHSPQLLMLSGIGPKEHLESFDIPVVADLPVGQNLMDHTACALFIKVEASNDTGGPQNPGLFPTPTTTLYAAVDTSQEYPDYQTINLLFPSSSSAQPQLCANVFKYNSTICDLFYQESIGWTTLFVVHNLMMPKSRGKVLLASTNSSVQPIVYTGTFSNSEDLDLMAASLEDFAKVLNSTYFINSSSSLVDPGMCPGLSGIDYWTCYAKTMVATMWHYSGTCSIGTVVDSTLKVIGVANMRVADASVMPNLVSGNINAAVTVIAEKAADMILNS